MSLWTTQDFKLLGGPITAFGSTVAFCAFRQYSRITALGGHGAALGCLSKLGTMIEAGAYRLCIAILFAGGAVHPP